MPSRLDRLERTYPALAAELVAELATVGFISPGSVVSRYTSCGKPDLLRVPTRSPTAGR